MELFGHVRGALHRRADQQEGKFALAIDGGTIFSTGSARWRRAAVEPLRVLQEREFEPLGSERSHCRRPGDRGDQSRHPPDGVGRPVPEDSTYWLNVIPITFRRCASGATTSRCWSITSCASTRSAPQADRRHRDRRRAGRAAGGRLAGQRPRVREHRRARRRLSPGAMIGADVVRLLGVPSAPAAGLPRLAAAEPGLGRT